MNILSTNDSARPGSLRRRRRRGCNCGVPGPRPRHCQAGIRPADPGRPPALARQAAPSRSDAGGGDSDACLPARLSAALDSEDRAGRNRDRDLQPPVRRVAVAYGRDSRHGARRRGSTRPSAGPGPGTDTDVTPRRLVTAGCPAAATRLPPCTRPRGPGFSIAAAGRIGPARGARELKASGRGGRRDTRAHVAGRRLAIPSRVRQHVGTAGCAAVPPPPGAQSAGLAGHKGLSPCRRGEFFSPRLSKSEAASGAAAGPTGEARSLNSAPHCNGGREPP